MPHLTMRAAVLLSLFATQAACTSLCANVA